MDEVEDSPAGSSEAAWRKQLDHQLIAGLSECVCPPCHDRSALSAAALFVLCL